MIKKFLRRENFSLGKQFSTYYRSEDSYFNFAFQINGQKVLNEKSLTEIHEDIQKNYQLGIKNMIIRLKSSETAESAERVHNEFKSLIPLYPGLQIQGFHYSMMVKQPTNQFLKNEFQFALKASQVLRANSKLGTYFLIECGDMFSTITENKDQKSLQDIFFNLDILRRTQQNLNFTNTVYLLKYYKQKIPKEVFEKFQEINKTRSIGIDLSINSRLVDSFLKYENLQDKKFSHEFLKYAYGFDEAIRIFKLHDFIAKDKNGEIVMEDAPLGEGVFDFNLLFNMMRLTKFGGVLTVPSNTTKEGFDKILKIMKENQYQEKTEEEIKEYVEFRQKKASENWAAELLI